MSALLIDAGVSLGSMALAPVFDFLKKKFIKREEDTPERTLGALATTKPEVMPQYMEALVEHLKAKKDWFNRDVIGVPSSWVVDLRAAIRPITVVGCLVLLFCDSAGWFGMELDRSTFIFCEANVSNWFGSRLVKN